jgi:hypothetical protein
LAAAAGAFNQEAMRPHPHRAAVTPGVPKRIGLAGVVRVVGCVAGVVPLATARGAEAAAVIGSGRAVDERCAAAEAINDVLLGLGIRAIAVAQKGQQRFLWTCPPPGTERQERAGRMSAGR